MGVGRHGGRRGAARAGSGDGSGLCRPSRCGPGRWVTGRWVTVRAGGPGSRVVRGRARHGMERVGQARQREVGR